MANNLLGKKFGRLQVVRYCGIGKTKYAQWECLCDCGNFKIISSNHLVNRNTQSCGCLARENARKRLLKHGGGREKICTIWRDIINRCCNLRDRQYKDYGGRGIKICDEWLNDFNSFKKWALENGYKQEPLKNGKNKWTIDRINNDGNYEPNNCRWVDIKTQSNNRRTNVRYKILGGEYTIPQIAQIVGINQRVLYTRIYNHGWDLMRAVNTNIKKTKGIV